MIKVERNTLQDGKIVAFAFESSTGSDAELQILDELAELFTVSGKTRVGFNHTRRLVVQVKDETPSDSTKT